MGLWERADTFTSFSNATPIKLIDPDGSASDWLGYGGLALSATRLVLAVASHGDDFGSSSNTGSVSVWERANTSTSFSDVAPIKLFDPDAGVGDYIGLGGLSLSADGLALAVSSYKDVTGVSSGSILVWERTNITISFSDIIPIKLVGPDGSAEIGWGGVTLAPNSLVLAVGSPLDDAAGAKSGSVLLWERSSTSTPFFDVTPIRLLDPDGREDDQFGYVAPSLSADSLVLAIVAPFDDTARGNNTGSVLVWERNNTFISFADVLPIKLFDPDGSASDSLGWGGASISANGLVLAVGSSQDDTAKGSASGSIIVWERSNTSTSFTNDVSIKLLDPDGNAWDMLGGGAPSLSSNGMVLAAASYVDNTSAGSNSGSILVWESICLSGYKYPFCID
mmetsp:Transcript_25377/g.63641  ORF Transcript_25377/g.63641 Transcript_25377/m.63641 type:complete len:393 (-) Transcript_25377:149-1327(-)